MKKYYQTQRVTYPTHSSYGLVLLITSLLTSYLVMGTTFATELYLGEPRNGLQASITISRKIYKLDELLNLTLTVTNVSNHSIQIDAWPGNWFVEVYVDDVAMNVVPPAFRAIDVIRPSPKSLALAPGDEWEIKLDGLRLITGLPGSTPDWEYSQLQPGKYWLGANYRAIKYPDRPNLWSGFLNCTLVKIEIMAG